MAGTTRPKYSLWLTPPEGSEARRIFADTIASLAFATPSAPLFPPHVTLLGGLSDTGDDYLPELLEKCKRLARESSPFSVFAQEVEAGPSYFRCILCTLAKSDEVSDALLFFFDTTETDNERLREEYFPHVSLMYGDISQGEKEAIAADAARQVAFRGACDFQVNALHLWCA